MSKQYNIMTSCDDSRSPLVAVMLAAISKNVKDAPVNFYLLHSNVSTSNIEMLDALSRALDDGERITFHEIKIPESDIGIYDELAEYGNGCPRESYYPLDAPNLLPMDIDRVLYLKDGDTIIVNDISPFYNYGFNRKSLIVTGARYHDVANGSDVSVYNESDLGDHNRGLPEILKGLFNSGSYIMNLEKMREDERSLADYQFLARTLRDTLGSGKKDIYHGDQGLLSAAFVGDIQYHYFSDIQNVFYMPYNFCMWYYNNYQAKPPYKASIFNYSGAPYNPWLGKYPIYLSRFQPEESVLRSLDELRENQAGYFYQWHEYAIITDSILTKIGY